MRVARRLAPIDRRPQPVPEMTAGQPDTGTTTDPPRRRIRILVVADDEVRTRAAALLAPYAVVDTVTDGRAALARLARGDCDLLMAAETSSGLDALLRALRASPTLRSLPVILLSTRSDVRGAARIAGADGGLRTPLDSRDLIATIIETLVAARTASAVRADYDATHETQRLALEEVEGRVTERTVERDSLRRQLSVAEEEERRRLARELHDEAGQHLTALGLGLHNLSDVTTAGSEVDRRVAQLRELADTLGRELHGIAVRLRPRSLDDFGLEAAIVTFAEAWSRQTGIRIDVHAAAASTRLPEAVENAVYRIVQEALTNVARHSGAARASVVVERRGGYVVTIVEDSGRGFVTAAEGHAASGRLGLLGIHERAVLLGGTVEIESEPGAGTTLYVRIPIDPSRSIVCAEPAR